MKKTILCCFLVLFTIQRGSAAGERIPSGGRALAMGGASVASGDLWSVCNNQAGIAWLRSIGAGAAFENRFLLKELMIEQIGIAIPMKAGAFGLFVNRFGNDQYSELKAGLSYARKFSRHFSAALQLDYLRIHINEDYGSKNLVYFEIGLMYHADKHLVIGVHLINPVPVTITGHPVERLPVTLCAGLTYRFSDEFLTTLEVEKDLENPMIFRAGAEYRFAKPAYARFGFAVNPATFTFGCGLEFGKVTIDIASGYHQALGFSPSGSVTYSF